MEYLKDALIVIVALLHAYIMYLEMFLWTKPKGLKAFKMTEEQAQQSAVLAANQGLYNGFLAAGLLWSIYIDESYSDKLALFFLVCVVVAAAYGGCSVGRKIFFIQGTPAILAILAVLVF